MKHALSPVIPCCKEVDSPKVQPTPGNDSEKHQLNNPTMAKYKLEYIWLDGYTPVPNLRSKTQIKEFASFPTLEQLPLWGFDGSSTQQAEGHSSDCVLKPVACYPDAARENGVLVMCEVMMPDGRTPHVSNKRATVLDDEGAWFGFEQEYFFYKDGRPLGFPDYGYPPPQGPYYTGVGYKFVGDVARWKDMYSNASPGEGDMIEAADTRIGGLPHTELAQIILDESGYTAMWQNDKTPEAPGRLENLKELIRSMEEYESLRSFLEHVALVMDAEQNAELDAVNIMTLHSAKGLEFDTVFLPGWEEGLFPHQRALDDQGRAGLDGQPGVGELRANPRARSAVMRVAERRFCLFMARVTLRRFSMRLSALSPLMWSRTSGRSP